MGWLRFLTLLGILSAGFVREIPAQSLHGIRIVSPYTLVEIYLNGTCIAPATNTCFVANLQPGNYRVEAYTPNHNTLHLPPPVFRQEIRYSGSGIYELTIKTDDNTHHHPSCETDVMDSQTFSRFMAALEDEPFDDGKIKLIMLAACDARFLTSQVESIVNLYTFDSGKLDILKKLYPYMADPKNYFLLLDLLDFSSSKEELRRFISTQR